MWSKWGRGDESSRRVVVHTPPSTRRADRRRRKIAPLPPVEADASRDLLGVCFCWLVAARHCKKRRENARGLGLGRHAD